VGRAGTYSDSQARTWLNLPGRRGCAGALGATRGFRVGGVLLGEGEDNVTRHRRDEVSPEDSDLAPHRTMLGASGMRPTEQKRSLLPVGQAGGRRGCSVQGRALAEARIRVIWQPAFPVGCPHERPSGQER
jgi:hypothetical protein